MMIPTVLDAYPTPPCARLLGLDILEADKAAGRVRIRFDGREAFCNASGCLQGGLLAAMLDDTIGPAVLIATDAARLPVTISMTITYLAPARPGPIFGEATVRQLGKTVGCVEAVLQDEQGVQLARATASVRLVTMGPPAAPAPAGD